MRFLLSRGFLLWFLGIAVFVLGINALFLLGFNPDDMGAEPLWQILFFHFLMGLLLLGAGAMGWSSLRFLDAGWWRLLPALSVLPVMLGVYWVEWRWDGAPIYLKEPIMFHFYLVSFVTSLMVSMHIILIQGVAVIASWVSFLLGWSWFFRVFPIASRVMSVRLDRKPS